MAQASDLTANLLSAAIEVTYSLLCSFSLRIRQPIVMDLLHVYPYQAGHQSTPLKFSQCPLQNVSYCPITTSSSSFTAVLYNPLSRSRQEYVRIPVSGPSQVTDGSGAAVPSTTLTNTLPGVDGSAEYSIAFIATLPAVGYATYFITPASNVEEATPEHLDIASGDIVVNNGVFTMTISSANGRIISVNQDATGDVIPFTQVNDSLLACCTSTVA